MAAFQLEICEGNTAVSTSEIKTDERKEENSLTDREDLFAHPNIENIKGEMNLNCFSIFSNKFSVQTLFPTIEQIIRSNNRFLFNHFWKLLPTRHNSNNFS